MITFKSLILLISSGILLHYYHSISFIIAYFVKKIFRQKVHILFSLVQMIFHFNFDQHIFCNTFSEQ